MAELKPYEEGKMSDYIDRQAAKLAIVEEGQRSKRYKIGEFWELNRDEAWNAIDSVPPADVVPVRHGRWIQISEMNLDRNVLYECSECHFSDTHAVGVDVPYCWNCGARMDGGGNDEH